MIDDDDLPPPRPSYDDKTAWGRINGRDRRRYARLWGVDLDRPAEDDCPSGEEEFNLDVKMMSSEHSKAEGPIGGPGHRTIDKEEFAAAWRPMTESEYLDEIIAERIAALGRRDSEPPDLDPEPRH
jgi:hypothetical protein